MQRDENNLIVQDKPSYDGGDTLNREGQFAVLSYIIKKYNLPVDFELRAEDTDDVSFYFEDSLSHLTNSEGHLVRHPTQLPWCNYKNVSRDQMRPILAAMKLMSFSMGIRLNNELEKIKANNYFYPNSERDYPNTTKSLLPQRYLQGSRFDESTIIDKTKWIWKPDHADIMTFDDIGMVYRNRLSYFKQAFCDFFLYLSAVSLCRNAKNDMESVDDMQFLCMVIVAKHLGHTYWSKKALDYYFSNRPVNAGSRYQGYDNVLGAIYWYFKGMTIPEQPDYDSIDFFRMWKPVIGWLRS